MKFHLSTALPKTFAKSRPSNRRGRRRGIAAIFVVLGLTMMLGFGAVAVDYGLLVSDANQLQRACDAAALAGAQELVKNGTSASAMQSDQANARFQAVLTARRNGVVVDSNAIVFPTYNTIRVPALRTRSFFFASVLGISNGQVTRSATAGRVPLSGVIGAVPLGITTNDYNSYQSGNSFELKLIRNHDTDFEAGTFTALDLRPDNSGKSPAVFERDLADGYGGTISLNEQINNALNASLTAQGAKLEDALADRFARASEAPFNDNGSTYTFPNYPIGNPRIVTLIVADPNAADNNNPMLTARLLVPVYLESIRSPGNNNVFIRMRILPIQTFGSQTPGIVIGNSTTPFSGPSTVLLMS